MCQPRIHHHSYPRIHHHSYPRIRIHIHHRIHHSSHDLRHHYFDILTKISLQFQKAPITIHLDLCSHKVCIPYKISKGMIGTKLILVGICLFWVALVISEYPRAQQVIHTCAFYNEP